MHEVVILLVEDNPGDVRVVSEVLELAALPHALHVVTDGDAALAFLYRAGEFSIAPRPDLMLLDLSLPRRDGRDVLAEVKHDAALADIPVIVLSSSDDERDVAGAYALHADLYLAKPSTFAEFGDVAERLSAFWRDRAAAH